MPFIKNYDERIAQQTAKNLAWKIDDNGFLHHPIIYSEEEAQRIWNAEYEQVRNHKGMQ